MHCDANICTSPKTGDRDIHVPVARTYNQNIGVPRLFVEAALRYADISLICARVLFQSPTHGSAAFDV